MISRINHDSSEVVVRSLIFTHVYIYTYNTPRSEPSYLCELCHLVGSTLWTTLDNSGGFWSCFMLWPETPTQRFREGKLEHLCVERKDFYIYLLDFILLCRKIDNDSQSSPFHIFFYHDFMIGKDLIGKDFYIFLEVTRLRIHPWKVNRTNWTEILPHL